MRIGRFQVLSADALATFAVNRFCGRDIHGNLLRVDTEWFRAQSCRGYVRFCSDCAAWRLISVLIVAALQAESAAVAPEERERH